MAKLYKEVPAFRDYTGIRSERPHGVGVSGCGYYEIPCPIDQGIRKLSEARSVPTDKFSSQVFSSEEIEAAFSGPNIAVKRTRVPHNDGIVPGLLIKCQIPLEEVLKFMKVREGEVSYRFSIEENGQLVLRQLGTKET